MRFRRAVIAGLGYELPPEVVTSAAIEVRLAPVYQRIGLVPGRLEMMSGIRERRFWPEPVRPSEVAARAGERAIAASKIARDRIDLLIFASVCRDFLEPATASVVHHRLSLQRSARVFDLSNACLGVVSAIEQAAALIDAGQIESALVVSGEDGRALVDGTIAQLLGDPTVDRRSIKPAFASLTIGSGAAAVLLASDALAPEGHRVVGSVSRTASEHHALCQGGEGGVMQMATDAEALLEAGLSVGRETWAAFLAELGWARSSELRTVTHQIGRAHTRSMYQALELDEATGYTTYDRLGNVGSASLPITLALAAEAGHLRSGHRVALLGIGSGVVSTMVGVEW
ncbi:MAG: 3-oxoacyl-ACP synthase III [Deltaproteobacteria bacterium]|nr:3-oxoacyl-ACP synthase III [Deltaproteobacteria bacterium]